MIHRTPHIPLLLLLAVIALTAVAALVAQRAPAPRLAPEPRIISMTFEPAAAPLERTWIAER